MHYSVFCIQEVLLVPPLSFQNVGIRSDCTPEFAETVRGADRHLPPLILILNFYDFHHSSFRITWMTATHPAASADTNRSVGQSAAVLLQVSFSLVLKQVSFSLVL
jgi:hypothetical protein